MSVFRGEGYRFRSLTGDEAVYPSYPFYTGLNERDRALAALAKAISRRDGYIPFIAVDPMLDSLHTDPGFASLLKQIGFTAR
jgi:hypothetical protein